MGNERVLITRRMPDGASAALLAAGAEVDVIDQDAPAAREEVLRRVAGVVGVIATLTDRIDGELLDAAGEQLRIVANYAVGYDNIDLAACAARDVLVSNTPDVLTDATADLAWALILAAGRRVVEADRLVRVGRWGGWAPMELLGLELSGATLGIVGAGRIGAAVARRAVGFGMCVLYCHPRMNSELEQTCDARRVDLDDLLPQADVLSLHVPMRPENHHLMSADRLRRMKPTALLINTARGAVVDEAALVAALREGRLGAAGLDVYEREPELTPGLAELPNVVLLPHLGSATVATRERMARMAAENVLAVLRGENPPNQVRN